MVVDKTPVVDGGDEIVGGDTGVTGLIVGVLIVLVDELPEPAVVVLDELDSGWVVIVPDAASVITGMELMVETVGIEADELPSVSTEL